MTFTVAELEVAINSDGNFWLNRDNDERRFEAEPGCIFEEFDHYGRVDILGIGIAEAVIIDREYEDDYEWKTWLIFKIGDRHFRKHGYYVSFGGGAWDGPLEEVKLVPVTREEWVAV